MQEHALLENEVFCPSVREPRFDEQTVIRAKQVVPLEEVRNKRRYRSQSLLAGAFLAALLLGAATALFAVYMERGRVDDSAEALSGQDDTLVQASTPLAVVEEASVTSDAVAKEREAQPTRTLAARKVGPVPERKTAARQSPVSNPPVDSPAMSEEEELHRIREAILFDQWQERRLRRAARRDRRNRISSNDRELLRVDELFEGQRRPQ